MSLRERRALARIDRELSGDPTLSRLMTLFSESEPAGDTAVRRLRSGRARLVAMLTIIVVALVNTVLGAVCEQPLWTAVALGFLVCGAALLTVEPVVSGWSAARSGRSLVDSHARLRGGRGRHWPLISRGLQQERDEQLD